MAKIPKEVQKHLRNIEKMLPKQYTETNATHTIVLTGAEIKARGIKTAVNVKEKQLYTKNKTFKTLRTVNHYLRMKRIWLKYKEQGVADYVTSVINFKKEVAEKHNQVLKNLGV